MKLRFLFAAVALTAGLSIIPTDAQTVNPYEVYPCSVLEPLVAHLCSGARLLARTVPRWFGRLDYLRFYRTSKCRASQD